MVTVDKVAFIWDEFCEKAGNPGEKVQDPRACTFGGKPATYVPRAKPLRPLRPISPKLQHLQHQQLLRAQPLLPSPKDGAGTLRGPEGLPGAQTRPT